MTGSNLTKLRVDNSTRKDAGKYTITASNSSGKDSADIHVSVVSCPSAPQGPLQYPGTTHDTVSLAWRPPEDDGGNDITGKQIFIITQLLKLVIHIYIHTYIIFYYRIHY